VIPCEQRYGRVGIHSPGIARIPHIGALIGADEVISWPVRAVDQYAGWGRKPNTKRVRARAERQGVPFLHLEDGFVRSLGLGVEGAAPLSVVVDDLGVYYDATRPSRLEVLLEGGGHEPDPLADPVLLRRAASCMAALREQQISKYNHAPTRRLPERDGRERVLIVDQTAGDLSLRLGMATDAGFEVMLRRAREEHPDAVIFVKTHPDVIAGKRKGHGALLTGDSQVHWLTQPSNPMALVQSVDRVYVMTSLMGFEALIAGKPVHCFGAPFYSGWGVTHDEVRVARRSRRRSVEEIFAAAYLLYARYVDPETGERCELETVIDRISDQRRYVDGDAGRFIGIGFSAWKRSFIPDFLQVPAEQVTFAKDAEDAERAGIAADARLLVWGARGDDASVADLAQRYGLPVWRLEDGFLRSVGLGVELETPASLVLDTSGMYFDPRTASDLETILQHTVFDDVLLARAKALRLELLESKLSKYNVGADAPVATGAAGRPVVLVVGQVEGDASLKLGGGVIRTNAALLVAAREAHPGAFLVYKPHPDVVSGNRQGAVPHETLRMVDEVNQTASLAACLGAAQTVHTMTSLVGFEALLRGLEVCCHGLPFYAGWGLTKDTSACLRRTRRLSLDELVAGTLLLYPRYVSRVTRHLTRPEVVVQQLGRARARGVTAMPSPQYRYVRQALNLVRSLGRAS
jgi:capsular polysaccharide export protein